MVLFLARKERGSAQRKLLINSPSARPITLMANTKQSAVEDGGNLSLTLTNHGFQQTLLKYGTEEHKLELSFH